MDRFSLFTFSKSQSVFLLVVIATVFGISYYQLKLGEMKARDVQRRSDTEMVAQGLREYFLQHENYPVSDNGKIVSCGQRGLEICQWGNSEMIDDENIVFIKNMPREPFFERGFFYIYEVNERRDKFRVYAKLENERDPVVKKNLTVDCGNSVKCNWYAGD